MPGEVALLSCKGPKNGRCCSDLDLVVPLCREADQRFSERDLSLLAFGAVAIQICFDSSCLLSANSTRHSSANLDLPSFIMISDYQRLDY